MNRWLHDCGVCLNRLKGGGDLDMSCDAIGKYLVIPFLAQLWVSLKTADGKARQVLQSGTLAVAA